MAHQKGGVGKTSIAVNIAVLAATQHERGGDQLDVLLLNTDPNSSANIWHRIRTEAGVKPDINLVDILQPSQLPATLSSLSSKYSFIVVDAGAAGYETFLRAAVLSDLVLVPVVPGQFESEQTLQVFEALRELDARHRAGRIPAFAVVNMVSNHATVGPRQIRELHELLESESVPYLRSILRHRQAWLEVGKEGKALHELGLRNSREAAKEMLAVFDEAAALASREE